MSKRKLFCFFLLIGIFILCMPACEKAADIPEVKNKEALIDQAKRDFLSYDWNTSHDVPFEIIKLADPEFKTPFKHQFDNCKINESKMFDYFKSPEGEEWWAVELDFVGIDKETNTEKNGVAIMTYSTGRYRRSVGGGGEAEEEIGLASVFTGGSKEEIKIIRAHARKIFDNMRQLKKIY